MAQAENPVQKEALPEIGPVPSAPGPRTSDAHSAGMPRRLDDVCGSLHSPSAQGRAGEVSSSQLQSCHLTFRDRNTDVLPSGLISFSRRTKQLHVTRREAAPESSVLGRVEKGVCDPCRSGSCRASEREVFGQASTGSLEQIWEKERRDEEHEWGTTSNRRLAQNEFVRLMYSKATTSSPRARLA